MEQRDGRGAGHLRCVPGPVRARWPYRPPVAHPGADAGDLCGRGRSHRHLTLMAYYLEEALHLGLVVVVVHAGAD